MAFGKKKAKKEVVSKTASKPFVSETKVDMAEEEVKSVDKIAVVPPKPEKPVPPGLSGAEAAIWRKMNK